MIKILTYGTFDLLHIGHIKLLKRAKSFGDYLIVGLSTDEFNIVKGKKSYYKYDKRKTMLENLDCVDFIIEENTWNQKILDIERYKIDILVMGDDWKGKFDFLNEYCRVIYFPRTPNISTTLIKQKMNEYI